MKRLAILHPSAARYRPQARLGMTLIEVLIATALTLVIMLALAQGFKTLSQGVTAGRSRLTGSDQLRGISSLLRADLAGMTANVRQMPNTQQAANGYFLYYDGPLSDSTAMLYNYVPTAATPEEKLSASRWSDIDDVLMFTAKAKDGQWFRGRVPLALLKIHAAQPINDLDWFTDVSVASEYAEIVWFMRPLNDIGGLNVDNASTPPQLVETPVVDSAPGVDRTGDGVPDTDGMPDRVALCRRVLLIRPDLQIELPSSVTGDPQKICLPMPFSDQDTARKYMRYPYQRCDLSVRAVYNEAQSRMLLRTNSLADLQNPENRFSHYVVPYDLTLPQPSNRHVGWVTSLPTLALTAETAPSATSFLNMISLSYGGPGLVPTDRGFVPAEFFRTKLEVDSNFNIIFVRPTLEEIVASNVVGFDVRGYDSSVQQLASRGSDDIWGYSDDPSEAGAPGTDDLVVSPSDPGYANILRENKNNNGPPPPPKYRLLPLSTGAFVDLCWGRRVINQVDNSLLNSTLGGMAYYFSTIPVNQVGLWNTPLSGFDPFSSTPLSSLQRSGRYNPLVSIYQPTFDTFTDLYESDDKAQWITHQGQSVVGFSTDGWKRYGGLGSNTPTVADQGIDGLDNNGNSVIDDDLELETRPPIVYPMPAIQVKFRIQDVPAGTLQEISMVHDLMGN